MLKVISVNQISTGDRLRSLDETQVLALVASIAEVGLINPIAVYPSDGGYGLVAGAHRLEAVKRLGLAEVDANVIDLSSLHRLIAECDENLVGSKLTDAERGRFMMTRKQAYEELHPEARQGGNWQSGQFGHTEVLGFVKDTAAKTGMSERAVRRHAERGMKITEKALATLRGTTLDTGTYLDKLKEVPAPEQVARIKADLAEEHKRMKRNGQSRNRHAARAKNAQAKDAWLAKGRDWWQRAPQEWRDEFLAQVSMDEAA